TRDDARDLAADLHRRDRRQRAGRSDGHRDVAAIGFFNSILLVFLATAASECGNENENRSTASQSQQKNPLPGTTTFPQTLKGAKFIAVVRLSGCRVVVTFDNPDNATT